MQTVKEKLHDMSAMRQAKADAKAGEKAEKELAKARVEIAHEVRLAREAEATMDMHVNKAEEKVEREIAKHSRHNPHAGANTSSTAIATGISNTDTDTAGITNTAGAPNPMANTAPANKWL